MNAKIKKIADQNFKANSDLKKQFIFDNGYCFFNEARAKEHAKETKTKYTTVKRDEKAMKKEADNAEKAKELQARVDGLMESLVDEKDEDKKKELEAEIEKLEAEIEALEK
jgi:protein subunit release factor A